MTPHSDIHNTTAGIKYLVTGASGFIGRAVCARLLQLGSTVIGASRRRVDLTSQRWTHARTDLANAEDVDRLVETVRPDYLIHLAGCVTGRREIEWVKQTMTGNLLSSVNLLVAAQNSGVRKVVLAGSLEEPDGTDAFPIAASPYAASKWCSSVYARTMHALYGTRSSVARIFMVYGPGQQDLTKFVPYVCLCATRGKAPEIMSGERPVDWIFIDDVADGLIRLCHAGPDDGSYVDLGSGTMVTTGSIANRICELAGTNLEPLFGALPDRSMEQVRKADLKATHALLGWSPSYDLDTGLLKALEWYRALSEADVSSDPAEH